MKSSGKIVYNLHLAANAVFSFPKLLLSAWSRSHPTWLQSVSQGNGGGCIWTSDPFSSRDLSFYSQSYCLFLAHVFPPPYTAISTILHSKVGQDKNVYSIYFFSLYKSIRDNFQYFYQLNSTIPEEHRPGWQPHPAWPFLLALLPNHLSFSYFLRFLTLSYTSFLTWG